MNTIIKQLIEDLEVHNCGTCIRRSKEIEDQISSLEVLLRECRPYIHGLNTKWLRERIDAAPGAK